MKIMSKQMVSEEKINMGGGCWVLERKLVVDGKEVLYCRLSDDYFTVSRVSADDMEFISDPPMICAAHIGYCFVSSDELSCDEKDALTELIEQDWYWEYNDMCRSWKELKAEKPKPAESIKKQPMVSTAVAQESVVRALKQHIETVDKALNFSDEWYEQQWTIGFAGLTVQLGNCAAVYNAVQEMIEEALA